MDILAGSLGSLQTWMKDLRAILKESFTDDVEISKKNPSENPPGSLRFLQDPSNPVKSYKILQNPDKITTITSTLQ